MLSYVDYTEGFVAFWLPFGSGNGRQKQKTTRRRTVKSGYLLLQLPPVGSPWLLMSDDPPIKLLLSPLPLLLRDFTIGSSR